MISFSTFEPTRIEINALWTGFAYPPEQTAKLELTKVSDWEWSIQDPITCEEFTIAHERIVRFLQAVDDISSKPDPVRFGVPQGELDSHYFYCVITDDSPSMALKLTNERADCLKIRSSSNLDLMLPWRIEDQGSIETYNPEVSYSLAEILPEGWMFQCRLREGSSRIISEYESQAAKKGKTKVPETPENQEMNAKIEEMKAKGMSMSDMLYELMEQQRNADYVKGKLDYSAEQILNFTESELLELIEGGFDISAGDDTGQTPLMYAAFPPFNEEQFKKLVKLGADVDATRRDSLTGLMLACSGGEQKVVPYWLEAGADPNLRTSNNSTAMMLGAKYPEMVRQLMKRGADVTAIDDNGNSALEYAMKVHDVMHAGRRLEAIEILAREIGQKFPEMLKHSLERAKENLRKLKLHNDVLYSMGGRPSSESRLEFKKKYQNDPKKQEIHEEMNEFFDLEITEVELSERIIEMIKGELQKIDESSN